LLRRHTSIEAEVLRASLQWATGGPEALASSVDGEMGRRRELLQKGMPLLAATAKNAPLLGCVATLLGVIAALAGGANGPADGVTARLLDNLAIALVCAVVGLSVATAAAVFHGAFDKKIHDCEESVDSIKKRLCAQLVSRGTLEGGESIFGIKSASSDITVEGRLIRSEPPRAFDE
jgi:biopolymer transport protein ExbB/TolQ